MATFAQLGIIADSAEFQQRVHYAASVAAVNVAAEDPATVNHTKRAAYATKVINGTFSLQSVCFGVLTNSTIAAEATVPVAGQPANGNGIPDGDIQFAINSIWNALAGS